MNADEAVTAVQRGARSLAPSELLAFAVADGVQVQTQRFGPAVALDRQYPTGAALLEAVLQGDPVAVGAALRALARVDGEALVEAALALAASGPLRRDAQLALAHSGSDAALAGLLAAFRDDDGFREPLARSVHPLATERVRALLAATGVTVFAMHPWPTYAEWHALTDAERAAPRARPAAAPPEIARAIAVIRVLGTRGDRESVELVVRLFQSHPNERLRIGCAHALEELDDPRAHRALDARWADASPTISNLAVRAAVFRDPAGAWARFEPHARAVLDDRVETPIDDRILSTLFYVCHGGMTPRRVVPDPFVIEPRFVELAAQLRRHPRLGDVARMVLEVVPRELAVAAIERHPYAEPAVTRVTPPARRDHLARYLGGEHAVWAELVALAPAIVQHADLHAEASAVAGALMRRVRHNTDAVRAALREAGARIASEATPATEGELARMIELGGRLPVALEAFWRVVGSIALTPDREDRYSYGACALEAGGLSLIALDPVALAGAGELGWCLDDHVAQIQASHREIVGALSLWLAPDFLHKQNISGGAPYSIELPSRSPIDAVDPRLDYTPYQARLVDYLRISFSWGGFPGLRVARRRADEIGPNDRIGFVGVTGSWSQATDRLLARLRRDLVDF